MWSTKFKIFNTNNMCSGEFSLLHPTMDALILTLENNESWISICYSAYFELLASPGHHFSCQRHCLPGWWAWRQPWGQSRGWCPADGDHHQPKESLSSKMAKPSSHVLILLTVDVIILYSLCRKLMLSSYSQLETSAGAVIWFFLDLLLKYRPLASLTGSQEVLDVLTEKKCKQNAIKSWWVFLPLLHIGLFWWADKLLGCLYSDLYTVEGGMVVWNTAQSNPEQWEPNNWVQFKVQKSN